MLAKNPGHGTPYKPSLNASKLNTHCIFPNALCLLRAPISFRVFLATISSPPHLSRLAIHALLWWDTAACWQLHSWKFTRASKRPLLWAREASINDKWQRHRSEPLERNRLWRQISQWPYLSFSWYLLNAMNLWIDFKVAVHLHVSISSAAYQISLVEFDATWIYATTNKVHQWLLDDSSKNGDSKVSFWIIACERRALESLFVKNVFVKKEQIHDWVF